MAPETRSAPQSVQGDGGATAGDGRELRRPPARAEAIPKPALAEGRHAAVSPTQAASRMGAVVPLAEITVVNSKDSVSESQGSTDSLPSVISFPCTSATLSPVGGLWTNTMSRTDSGIPALTVLRAPPRTDLAWEARPSRRGAFTPPPPAFLVPTPEQRDEADRRLRDFQHAQIQRLMLQRRLSQSPSDRRSPPFSGAPERTADGAPALTSGDVFPVGCAPAAAPVLRPPPGLPHPSAALQRQEDAEFLADNELFLARLLDDDDDEDKGIRSAASPQSGGPAPSPTSSLDPAAAPFVAATHDGSMPAAWRGTDDAWRAGPRAAEARHYVPLRIGGVYGGSVW